MHTTEEVYGICTLPNPFLVRVRVLVVVVVAAAAVVMNGSMKFRLFFFADSLFARPTTENICQEGHDDAEPKK